MTGYSKLITGEENLGNDSFESQYMKFLEDKDNILFFKSMFELSVSSSYEEAGQVHLCKRHYQKHLEIYLQYIQTLKEKIELNISFSENAMNKQMLRKHNELYKTASAKTNRSDFCKKASTQNK